MKFLEVNNFLRTICSTAEVEQNFMKEFSYIKSFLTSVSNVKN